MPSPDLVVVGFTTDTTTRIFVGTAQEAQHASIAFTSGDGEIKSEGIELTEAAPYRVGTFELEKLPASKTIDYSVAVGASAVDDARRFLGEGESYSLRLLPSDRPLRIGLVSCNGPEEYAEGEKFEVWKELARVVRAGGVDLLLHAGDQIYADPIWKAKRADGSDQALDPDDPECLEGLTQEYREYYWKAWKKPTVRSVLASVPSVMMWDDHDIVDGWGSSDIDKEPGRQALFKAARQAFAEFQASHAPPPIDPGNSFATGFDFGGVAVLMIDGRSNRDYFDTQRAVIVGEKQWESIDAWLKDLLNKEIRRLFVVVGVPPVHIKAAAAEHLAGALRHHILDDLRDGWASPRNLGEAHALLLRLFNFMVDSPETEVTILSGDVHVGTAGTLQSKYLAHNDGSICNPIYQVTSSAIGREPPSGAIRGAMALLQGKVHLDLGHTVEGHIFQFPETDECFLGSRNFAVLSLEEREGEWSPHGNLTVTYYSEDYDPIRQRLHRIAPID